MPEKKVTTSVEEIATQLQELLSRPARELKLKEEAKKRETIERFKREKAARRQSTDSPISLEWMSSVTEVEKVLEEMRKIVQKTPHTIHDSKREFDVLDLEAHDAIEYRDIDMLRRILSKLRALASEMGDHRLAVTTRKVGSNGTAEIKGIISGPVGLLPRGFCLELVNEDVRPEWRSGWLPLDPTGDFCVMASVHSEATTNEFSVALRDSSGKPKRLLPNYFVTRA